MLAVDMKEKAALVVGGARGIGAAAVRLLGKAGARAAWTHLGTEPDRAGSADLHAALRDLGAVGLDRAVDCTDADGTRALVADLLGRWDGVDYLVYCAGLTAPASFLDITPEAWRCYVEINLTGAYIALQAVIPVLLARGGGSIVLVGSAAVISGGGGRADYIAAKAGLEGLNRAITKEFAPRGIRCNLVHPSLIETDLLAQRYPDPAARRAAADTVPLRRLGRPEDIAHAALFLLSDHASYITGQSLFVDGGRTFCK